MKKILIVLGILLWAYIVARFENIRLFSLTLPPILFANFSKNKILRNRAITVFVVIWLVIFFSESTRFFFRRTPLPQKVTKIKFLFPPMGWIMFWNIDNTFSNVEVFGVKDAAAQPIDPHDIVRTRTIGYDNIHRGILGSAATKENYQRFCNFLFFRLPYFDKFVVTAVYYPDMSRQPYANERAVLYQCLK